ncbi:MAG: beta strand repeat-containing protein, partial [Candidatus Thorarchaeota archaeon]
WAPTLVAGSITVGSDASDLETDNIYLNFLNGDFYYSYIASDDATGTIVYFADSGDTYIDVPVNDSAAEMHFGAMNDLFVQADITLTSPNSLLGLHAGNDINLSDLAGLTIDIGGGTGTLVAEADIDDNDTGRVYTGAGNRLTLNVENLVLIAATGINVETTGDYNLAASNDVSGDLIVDNNGNIGIFDATTIDALYPDGVIADGQTVALKASNGSITDEGATVDITGDQAVLAASNGIGSDGTGDDALETDITYLTAFNASANNIAINNNNPMLGLTINSVVNPWLSSGVRNDAGTVTITESTPIIVNSPIWATGAITLTANDTVPGDNTGYIDINNTITSSASSVTLIADDDIDMGANVNANTTLTMTADADGSGVGSIIQTAGTATGPTMNLSGVAIGSAANPLSIDAANLTAQADGTPNGDIYLEEENDITLTNVTTVDGVINITSGITIGGEMNAVNVVTGNDNDITLVANNDDITITAVNAGAGDVVITATGGSIGNAAGTATANDLTLTAAGNIQVGTDVNRLQATGNGAILINENDGVELADINGFGYSVRNSGDVITQITRSGLLTITDQIQSAGAPVELDSGGGNIAQNADIDTTYLGASGGEVMIDAGGTFTMAPDTTIQAGDSEITIGDSSPIGGTVTLGLLRTTGNVEINTAADVVAANNSAVEIQANDLEINAGTGVGLGANHLNTDVATLRGIVANNNLLLYETNNLQIDNLDIQNGTGEVSAVNILVDIFNASGQVTLASTGAITDINGASTNVTANALMAYASNGIDLDTSVSQIGLTNFISGDIDINNDSATGLTITTLGSSNFGSCVGIENDPGNINIISTTGIIIDKAVSTNTGTIDITATSPVQVNAGVSSAG